MTVTIKLNGLIGRILLASAILLLGIFSVAVIFSHFTVRAVADRRISPDGEALGLAATRLPNSARVQFRLAEAIIIAATADTQRLSEAITHAELAANLSPWNYRNWRLLAVAQESDGRMDEAEKSMLLAVRFAPNYFDVNWMLANLFLRRGKLDESLQPFRVATNARSELLPIAFDLLWQASNGDLTVLESLAGDNSKARLSLTRFLAEQTQTDAAISVFRGVESKAKLNSPDAAAFVSSLINVGQSDIARRIWLETVSVEIDPKESGNLIWNGGFEKDVLNEFNHFDWFIGLSDYARIGFDREISHAGARSLKVSFVGRDTTRMLGEIRQLVVLKPNARYRLECYAKAESLITPEGPRLAILGPNGVIVATEPVLADSTDWQHLSVDFVAPTELTTTKVSVVRIPRFSYDDPTKGIVWFDDFKLTER